MHHNATQQSPAVNRRGKVWPHIYRRRYTSGLTAYVVDLGLGLNKKRQRQSFPTREEAQTFAERKRVERANEGAGALTLPSEVRREAAICAAKLATYGACLTEATEYFVEHVLRYRTSPPVAGIIDQLLAEGQKAGCRNTTLHTLKGFLCRFSERFGPRQLPSLTLEELNDVCLAPELAARTRFNRIRMVSQLYNFALRHEWVKENLTKRITVPLQADHVPEYLEVQDVRRLLEQAPEFGLLAYVALGLFAGIRRAELLRLDWSAVNRVDREITVGPEIAKTRSRRVIPFDETLAAWLRNCPQAAGPIVNSATFERNWAALRKAAGIREWPVNGLRHSFATYHVAHFRDPVRTAYLLGHRGGTDMLDSHYRGLVSTIKAKEYWTLRPSTVRIQPALREAA